MFGKDTTIVGFGIFIFCCGLLVTSYEQLTWDSKVHDDMEVFTNVQCSIDTLDMQKFDKQDFQIHILEKQPIVIKGIQNNHFQALTTKGRLLDKFGNTSVTLSTANTISHDKVKIKFRDYLLSLKDQKSSRFGNESLYLFGPESELSAGFAKMLEFYREPAFLPRSEFAFSFGIGYSGSGVPFHIHGHGFSEVIHGKKRWILFPPQMRPQFDPDESSFWWLKQYYPQLSAQEKAVMQDCIIGPGELLYFPSEWWHATINLGETVFVSSFGLHQKPKSQQKNLFQEL